MESNDLAPGTAIGDFTLSALLSDSPSSVVYRATRDGDEAVVKLAKLAGAQADATTVERFRREGALAQRVSHPALVPVIATGIHDGHPWLAQPFVAGGTLEAHLERNRQLTLDETVWLIDQLAGGLDALHAARIVHRNLNPTNILLDDSDGTMRALITDFGLVKDLRARNLTVAGTVLGSSDYISPEQIRGAAITAAADVYALGCVVFEMLTGQPPFADRDGMMVVWAHLSEAPDPVRKHRPEVAPEVDALVARALRKQPEERPFSAGSFAHALSQATADTRPSS
jgi:serine/threonine-protein kinase